MKFNLANKLDEMRFDAKCEDLKRKKAYVELTDKSGRTRKQNSYEHLIIGMVAMDIGVSVDYCKEHYFKRLVNPDIFVRTVMDRYAGEITITRSTRELSIEETSMAIDRFKRWCHEQGYYLPEPTDNDRLKDIEMQMGRMEIFIGM